MPTPNAALANVIAQAVIDTFPGANFSVYDSGDNLLAQAPLPTPAGTAALGVITWDMDPAIVDDAIVLGGQASYATIDNGTETLRLTVGLSAADAILNTLTVSVGGSLSVESLTTTVPSA